MDWTIVICGIAAIAMVVLSFVAAYKTVNRGSSVGRHTPQPEGEVSLDDICEQYLKLTNLD